MFLLRAVLYILVRNASPRWPMCFRYLIFSLSVPCVNGPFVLCVACLTVFVNCLVKQFAMCLVSRCSFHMFCSCFCMSVVISSFRNLRAGSQVFDLLMLFLSEILHTMYLGRSLQLL